MTVSEIAAPTAPSPAASAAPTFERFLEPSGWIALNPALHVCSPARLGVVDVLDVDAATGDQLEALLVREGYFHVPQVNWNLPIAEMAAGIGRLVAAGLVPPFAFMYDEYWLIYFKLHKLLSRLLGEGYMMLPDFWAWHVDPRAGESGWRPHRDKGRMALFPDRRPKSLTIWLPLTDATPLNGCMYLVPADRDPTYGTEQEAEWRFAYQDVRALPSAGGGLFCWNQAVLHWGSATSRFAKHPRLSMALEFQRGDIEPFNRPLIPPFSNLTFEDRLKLVGKQILQYKHMYPLAARFEHLARRLLG